jgi:hypothetical protein
MALKWVASGHWVSAYVFVGFVLGGPENVNGSTVNYNLAHFFLVAHCLSTGTPRRWSAVPSGSAQTSSRCKDPCHLLRL